MPHAHGIAWLKKEVIAKYLNPNGSYNDRIHELIQMYMSCSLDNKRDDLNNIYNSKTTENSADSNDSGKVIFIVEPRAKGR